MENTNSSEVNGKDVFMSWRVFEWTNGWAVRIFKPALHLAVLMTMAEGETLPNHLPGQGR